MTLTIRALFGFLLLFGASVSQPSRAEKAAWRLTWFAIVATPEGPLSLRSPERTTFATQSDCTEFAERTLPRMQDWVRGVVRADWDHEVRVAYKCEADGVPS